jgi:hypothetical protein
MELAALIEEKSAGYGDAQANAKDRIDVGVLTNSDAPHRLAPDSN